MLKILLQGPQKNIWLAAVWHCLLYINEYSQTCAQRTPLGPKAVATGDSFSKEFLYYKNWKWNHKMVLAVDKWSFFGDGR